MPKVKKVIEGPNGSFLMSSPDPVSRGRVTRATQVLLGPDAGRPNFLFRLADDHQLPTFAVRRIDVTVGKLMHAVAELFAEGDHSPRLLVEGAKLQDGTGNSRRVVRDGKSYFVGYEAAHFGIGTFTAGGRAVSDRAYDRVRELAAARRVPPQDLPARFPASSGLTALGLNLDAGTFAAAAYFNRTEGLLEVVKQHYMRGVLPTHVPGQPAQLERALCVAGERLLGLLAANHRAVVRPIEDRLRALRADPRASEFLQDPADAANRLFGGREREALAAMLDMVRGRTGEYRAGVEFLSRDLSRRAADYAGMAEAARAERA